MFKFELSQNVFIMYSGKYQKATIVGRKYVDYAFEPTPIEQEEMKLGFYSTKIWRKFPFGKGQIAVPTYNVVVDNVYLIISETALHNDLYSAVAEFVRKSLT